MMIRSTMVCTKRMNILYDVTSGFQPYFAHSLFQGHQTREYRRGQESQSGFKCEPLQLRLEEKLHLDAGNFNHVVIFELVGLRVE
jgi:hypothetical protein